MHSRTPNRLINEKSPYLLQHAYNPVNWFPWSEEAFRKASNEDKPIFLSIGYSTCHWCHVMESESFENDEVASILNKHFVSIKVDREERPDLDHIYMLTCQIINGNGGWPLSLFLTPKKEPFYAGTYFPRTSKYGRIGFVDLLKSISATWGSKKDQISASANQIMDYLKNAVPASSQLASTSKLLQKTFAHFSSRFDSEFGGFGEKPKFPSPHNLMFLLRYYNSSSNDEALQMVVKTLNAMRLGGIYDQIGFGFHRYSTDREWLVPHFEKMLYDQAMMIRIYTEAYQLTKDKLFKQTAEEIISYVLRDMTSNEGAFYTAEDADSEGVEGKFYTWEFDEIKSLLNKENLELELSCFNIRSEGNYLDESSHTLNGFNIPHLKESAILENETTQKILSILHKYREKRIRPLKDQKVLTDLNGMMISSLAFAGKVFRNESYIQIAERAASFVKNNLYTDKNNLLHRYMDGEAIQDGFIDDYAYMIWGMLELFQSTMNAQYLQNAINLMNVAIKIFWDDENGGFFFTSEENESLILRSKEYYDGAIPSGNSVMAYSLNKLSSLTFDSKYDDYYFKLVSSNGEILNKSLYASSFIMSGLIENETRMELIAVVDKNNSLDESISRIINENYIPNLVLRILNLSHPLPDGFREYKMLNDKPTYYLCKNHSCEAPTNNTEEILKSLLQNNF